MHHWPVAHFICSDGRTGQPPMVIQSAAPSLQSVFGEAKPAAMPSPACPGFLHDDE